MELKEFTIQLAGSEMSIKEARSIIETFLQKRVTERSITKPASVIIREVLIKTNI